MKKLIILVAGVLMFMPATFYSMDENPVLTSVTSFESVKKVTVTVNEVFGSKTLMQVYNSEGAIVHSQKVRNTDNTFYQNYDFSESLPGDYKLVIKDDMRVEEIAVNVSEENVSVLSSETTYRPTINRINRSTFDLQHLVLGEETEIEILNENGDRLHYDFYDGQEVVTERYNLINLERGAYTVKVRVGENTFYESIIL